MGPKTQHRAAAAILAGALLAGANGALAAPGAAGALPQTFTTNGKITFTDEGSPPGNTQAFCFDPKGPALDFNVACKTPNPRLTRFLNWLEAGSHCVKITWHWEVCGEELVRVLDDVQGPQPGSCTAPEDCTPRPGATSAAYDEQTTTAQVETVNLTGGGTIQRFWLEGVTVAYQNEGALDGGDMDLVLDSLEGLVVQSIKVTWCQVGRFKVVQAVTYPD